MISFTSESVVDLESYEELLNSRGFILYDREAALDLVAYLKSRADTFSNRALFVMKLHSGCFFISLNKDAIYRYLTEFERCPDNFFKVKGVAGVSLDKKKVLEKLVGRNYAVEFLTEYMAYKSAFSRHNNLKSLVASCDTEEKDGLYCIPFTASQQKNLRFNYRQCDIISQIPKEACDCICVEPGYFLAWGDFAQSDFRIAYNLFIRSKENDEIMNAYDDKYEALARIVSRELGTEFDLEKFKEERDVYKRMTLATMYGTRNSVIESENVFIQTFSKFLEKCPKYQEYLNRLRSHLILKRPIRIESYFGHEEFIAYEYDEGRVIDDALNSPVQTGTSEIVIMTVNSIINMARDLGLNEDQFSVYLVRHDEPIFRIRKDALPYVWILNQHQKIVVDEWTPLAMDFSFGYNYLVKDEDLMREVNAVYEQNSDKITIIEASIGGENKYFPIKPLLRLEAYCIETPDGKTILTFYEAEKNRVISSLLETSDVNVVAKCLRKRISDAQPRITVEYQNVYVANNILTGEDYFKDTYAGYKVAGDSACEHARMWCEHMVAVYCEKIGITNVNYRKSTEERPDALDIMSA